jgi:adenylate kinase
VVIIFLGPPGSGKGTQAAIISKILSIPSLSTSGILNDVIKNGGEFARELQDYMSSGKLVPSTLVNEIVATTLSKEKYSSGCILDGYPRTVDQAEFLDIRFPKIRPMAVYCEISYEALIERISGRFSCTECGAIYNKLSAPTKTVGVCDVCNATQFKIRDDDNIKVLQKRWEVYIEETRPLLEYYGNKGSLVSVDATLDKEEITSKLIQLLQLSV